MRFRYTIDVEVERTSGKFASRETISEQIYDELDSADPGTVDGDDDGGQYEVTGWEVSEEDPNARP